MVIDTPIASGRRERIRVIATGNLVTSARAAWALCVWGVDFIHTARGFLLALGCIQALRCHSNACPTRHITSAYSGDWLSKKIPAGSKLRTAHE
jgi:glutamate synthase domain-containing protein 2